MPQPETDYSHRAMSAPILSSYYPALRASKFLRGPGGVSRFSASMTSETCALTTSSLLSETPYFAEGVAETDMRLMLIPAADFQLALRTAPGFMAGLLSDYARRIASLTALVDRLTSRDLETELRALLEDSCDAEGWVSMSHQEIAIELGTAREVVSRRLKELERSGLAKLGRGRLQWLGLSAATK